MEQNFNNGNLLFYDFFSFPHNPEDLFTLLYLLYKNEKYEIYKGIYNETRDIFCIKIIPLDKTSENSSKSLFQKIKQETLLMKTFKNCENITHYYGSFLSFKSKSVWLIYEYCPAGSTYDLMNVINRPLSEEEISIIMNDIIHGLIYIHQLNIFHRNIKITNILLNENGNAQLNNFSKSFQKINNENFINQKDEINYIKYDILLIGITCIELYKGLKDNSFNRKIFLGKIKNNQYKNININKEIESLLHDNSNNDKYISKEFIDFIQKCIESNPSKRQNAFELSKHSFIKKSLNSINKTLFINVIKESIEKIENNKKENFTPKTSKKRFDNFYNSIYCNTKNTVSINISNNEKNSINISNLNNNTNDVNMTNVDKLAEFRIEQMKKEEELEYDKFTNKDLYYSNINDSNNTSKESAVFGKREVDKSCKIQKKSLLPKNSMKKNEKEDIAKTEEHHSIKKDSDELDFKANLERLNKYEELFKSKISDQNINFNYNHKLIFNDDDSINLNSDFGQNNSVIITESNNSISDIEKNKPEKYIPFSEIKCDIIHLGSSIKQRKREKSLNKSEYSLKNSLNKSGDNKYYIDCKDNNIKNIQKKFLLLSFGNNTKNEPNKKMDVNAKDKNNKNDISTCFSSFNNPKCNKQSANGGMMDIIFENHKSCKHILHLKKNNYEDDVIYNDNYCNNFQSERTKSPFLYKYINDYENPKVHEISNKKSNIIKIDKNFINIKAISLDKNIKNVLIKGKNN